jgi:hypothetical protein
MERHYARSTGAAKVEKRREMMIDVGFCLEIWCPGALALAR